MRPFMRKFMPQSNLKKVPSASFTSNFLQFDRQIDVFLCHFVTCIVGREVDIYSIVYVEEFRVMVRQLTGKGLFGDEAHCLRKT